MPGLVGFTDKDHKYGVEMLLKMRRFLKYADTYVDEALYSDTNVYASHSHLGNTTQGHQPYLFNNRLVWVAGEFYNKAELKSKYGLTAAADGELLLAMYEATGTFEFLQDIDGCFAATMYDKKENKIHLATDRYGFKPLYWGLVMEDLVWSSELKGFLGHTTFRPKIDPTAVEEFFRAGYLLENRTWFDGVEMVPPASILTYDLRTRKIDHRQYWHEGQVKPLKDDVDEGEIAEELGRVFVKAVRSCVAADERVGLTLSGGLDSRAIFAAFPDDVQPLHAFTFGQKGCDDVTIASCVARLKKSTHHILELNASNWLKDRIGLVWKVDASFSIADMHGMEFVNHYKKYTDIHLSGTLGDAILGGSYIVEGQTVQYRMRNRGRRFINHSLVGEEAWMIHRRPFFNNAFFELTISIPEVLREDSHIYNRMLLATFPDYYKNIPWQRTGRPISYRAHAARPVTFVERVAGRLARDSQRIRSVFNGPHVKHYTDYQEWITREPARSFFEKLLLNKNALYPEYVDRDRIRNYIKRHMAREHNYQNQLCLALTFELWLQQVFEADYRDLTL